jgi:hypothetical protein
MQRKREAGSAGILETLYPEKIMKKLHVPLWPVLCVLWSLPSSELLAGQFDIQGPPGSGTFGQTIRILSNGNFVVVDAGFDIDPGGPGQLLDVGKVYLFSADGTLLSTLTGSRADDRVGDAGVFTLTNGNFIVFSKSWDNGAGVTNAGAVTWGSQSTGFIGGPHVSVSAANSLVGTTAGDQIGINVVPLFAFLPNGNYVVISPLWNNEGATDAGAVTWCNAATGTVGPVTAANSLVGSAPFDEVGADAVVVLANGHYVVSSPGWNSPSGPDFVGAVTWCNSNGSTVGPVTAANSLVGSQDFDQVGVGTILALKNGHYVVPSPDWNGSGTNSVGAVTWCNGNGGTVGAVSASNSLVGTSFDDRVGNNGVVELANGHYVVGSNDWNNPSPVMFNVGAVTWGDGDGGTVGPVSPSNSIVGSTAEDRVSAAIPLSNGHYVICASAWDNGTVQNAGAAMWVNGNGPASGQITPANALVGSTQNDQVGNSAAFALANGAYIVRSSVWNNGTVQRVGAVTWANGNGGLVGVVSPANSLVGSTTDDRVGTALLALSNGNYVVRSSSWDHGAIPNVGAVTWANGTTGITGTISSANSLVGSTAEDAVGNQGVVPLPNGNYVVFSRDWDNDGAVNAGAVTWGNGTTGVTGLVNSANSLVGTQTNDNVGTGSATVALPNGNYVIASMLWDNGGIGDAGAVTWGNGATGTTGAVSAANSLVGTNPGDRVGVVLSTTDGHYLVRSSTWDNPGVATDAGMVIICKSTGGSVGAVTAANGFVGMQTMTGALLTSYDQPRDRILIGRPGLNRVTIYDPAAGSVELGSKLFTATEASGNAAITLVRSGGSDGAVSVKLTVTPGSATTADYLAPPGNSVIVNFAHNETAATVNIPLMADAVLNEPNETFTVTLSNPVGTTLGTIKTATVRVLEAEDIAAPTAPVIASPVSGARVGVNAGGTLTITGTAAEGKGQNTVQVALNNGPFTQATITSVSGTTVSWAAVVTPRTGANTVKVRSIDSIAVPSPLASRTFIVTRPLIVQKLGGGSFTNGFFPSSFREVGKPVTVTATAAAGFLFHSWSVNGGANTLKQMGVSADALRRNTITFVFNEALQLTANFLPNPYTTQVAGTFNGEVTASDELPNRPPLTAGPEDFTPPSYATEGLFKATVQGTGAFSGTLTIDGFVLNLAGSFDANGVARFGTSRATTLSVARAGKTSLAVALQMNPTPVTATITGTVTQYDPDDAQTPLAVSEITAGRASYNGTTMLVPTEYLGTNNANGIFTMFLAAVPPHVQPSGIPANEYPSGNGFATITLTKSGAVSVSGLLADGEPFTASTTLSQGLGWRFLARPYASQGLVAATVTFADLANTDLQSLLVRWYRPILDRQHYPKGWPDGIVGEIGGTKYEVETGFSIIPGLPSPDADGNADLRFFDGKLLAPFPEQQVTISGIDSVTEITEPANFSLSINRTTGRISGTFNHNLDNAVTPFQGVVLQKGFNSGAAGYFLTNTPPVKDYTGEGGAVSLVPQ